MSTTVAMESPVAELLGTNQVPTDEQVTQIREVIAKTEAELARLDKEIAETQERLKQLEDERDETKAFMEARASVSSDS
jgi:peptidoglycan hydrolase CwlO-like protein